MPDTAPVKTAVVSGGLLGAALGMASCIGVLTADQGDVTSAGWVVLGLIAAGIGSGAGIAIAALASYMVSAGQRRTKRRLMFTATGVGVVSATLVSLNWFGHSTAAVAIVSFGSFSAGFLTARAALNGALDGRWPYHWEDPIVVISGAAATGAGLAALHADIGDRGLSFSPAALVVYGLLLAVPIVALITVAGTSALAVAGLSSRRRRRAR